MNPSSPSPHQEQKPHDSRVDVAEYTDQPTLPISVAEYIDQPTSPIPVVEYADQPTQPVPTPLSNDANTLADANTQPVPTLSGPSTSPPASAHIRQVTPAEERTSHPSSAAEGSIHLPPGAQSHRRASARRTGRSVPHRRTSRRGSKLQIPPWLTRLALLLGLVVLGVRAGFASSTFMRPGGAILGWSDLPVAHCVVCHLAHPTTNTQSSQPLTPEQYAAMLLPQLTLDEKLGQMMMVQFVGLQPTPDIVQMMNTQDAGGVLLYEDNIGSADQLRSLNAQLRQLSAIPDIPPLLAVDQEGGTVNRLINLVGPLPPASSLQTTQEAEARGIQDGELLAQYGFNLDLAPVVDVGTANPQLYERTFGSDPDLVASLAGAYLQGLQQNGKITGTLKHFPGLGDTTTDPHLGLPILYRSQTDWENIDLEPYRVILKNENVRAIMVTHELIPAVDPEFPASLSPALINGVLRGQLGFNGVVITDSLYMGALNQRWSVPQAAVLAIKAGADIVIGPADPQTTQQVIDAIKQALSDGTLTLANINTAVQRILALKIEMGLIPLPS